MSSLVDSFLKYYRRAPEAIVSAPAAVHLMGGLAGGDTGRELVAPLPMRLRVGLARRKDSRAYLRSSTVGGESALSLEKLERSWSWSDHVAAIAARLLAEGRRVPGFELFVESEIPPGAGLGSSDALHVATAVALSDLAGLKIAPLATAWLCQLAAREFLDLSEPIGKAAAGAASRAGEVLLVDGVQRSSESAPLPLERHRLLLVDTRVRHSSSQLARGHWEAAHERALGTLRQVRPEIDSSRDITDPELESLPAPDAAKVRLLRDEDARAASAFEAVAKGDMERLGELMRESQHAVAPHAGDEARDVTAFVRLLETLPGVLGARVSGDPASGGVVAIARAEAVPEILEKIERFYSRVTGRQAAVSVLDSLGTGVLREQWEGLGVRG